MTHALHILPLLLLLVGLRALHTHQVGRTSWIGCIGFYLSLMGMVLLCGVDLLNILAFIGGLQTTIPVDTECLINQADFFFWAVGSVLFGITGMRVHLLPRSGAWLIMGLWVALFGGFVLRAFPNINDTFSIGWIWLGYQLCSEKSIAQAGLESIIQ